MTRSLLHPRVRTLSRRLNHRAWRRCVRPTADRFRGPDDLASALTAFRRALRCQRRLAALAPCFFDSTTVDRARHEAAARYRWLASWEPLLAKVYDVAPDFASLAAESKALPPLPSRRTQRAVARHLAGWDFWIAAADLALDRYQRRPHAVPRLAQILALLEISLAFRQAACGSFRPDPEGETAAAAAYLADLRRAYPPPAPDGG